MGELSETFEIKTGLRQDYGLLPLQFNWRQSSGNGRKHWPKDFQNETRVGCKNTDITFDCLAFAYNVMILATVIYFCPNSNEAD